MMRETIVVKKTEVFKFLEDPKVAKIEIKRGANYRNDDTIIKIYVYKQLEQSFIR